ncbi:patatin-like phospholipase family protein [Actinoallomurus rhizosphaericola]|uniref:patatin-like phospholipase family protein n=1 Tax=Actinoallomurus rhizosphaericola TaxID=2952536 RepID=UPI00209233FE|nr:patatin-like phospholipase family protein [Actinoallomurus rhizosphaericola]MCO5999836.1 patatin-like phospholipase family protein [Actinoallomurus rhizosphaericola]
MSTTRALVLGGGGITGIGWEVGVLAGLLDEGVDLRGADTVIGTSAGSFVGANYTSGTDWEALFADQAHAGEYEPVMRTDPGVYEGWAEAFRSGAGDPEAVGAAFGRVARKYGAGVDAETRLGVVRARLRTSQWPANLRIAVTDADTGRLRLLGPDAGISIEAATAASGAVPGIWPSVRFDGREWIDAGMVSAANATLAAGHDRIIVFAPMHGGYAGIPSAQDDVARLNDNARAFLSVPDEVSREAIGSNPYDPDRARVAAEAGRRQGRVIAADVAAIWG